MTLEQRAKNLAKTYEEQLEAEAKATPLKHFGTPDDIANATEFLISDKFLKVDQADGGKRRVATYIR